jgi:polyribonucleotide 5'-hydroxyl-kinase
MPSFLFHVIGKAATEYVSDETPMIPYTNLHLAFEQKRVLANRASRNSPPPPGHDQNNESPPRVLIIGPENSGKTTVTKILANYAIRSPAQWAPIVVNLDTNDVSRGGWATPGVIRSAYAMILYRADLRLLGRCPLHL